MSVVEGAMRVGEGEVHAWHAWLDPARPAIAAYFALLAPAERERASRFRIERDRDRFIVARGIRRELVARYTGIAAHAVAFAESPSGKPALLDAALEISASRSGAHGAYAVAHVPVGIDIEVLRPLADAEAIMMQHFSAAERSAWRASAPKRRLEVFFRLWTRKEAYVKGLGVGLSRPLDSFSVHGESARSLVTDAAGNGAQPWLIADLSAPVGCVAALAVRGAEPAISQLPYADAAAGARLAR